MFVILGLACGGVFGLASALANRVWGTVLACIPVTAWFVVFVVAQRSGLTSDELSHLDFAMCGIIVGLFTAIPLVHTIKRRRGREQRRR